MSNVTSWCMNTARNATDISQIVNFISSLQPVNKLQQTCHFHQVATSLLKSTSHLQICYKLQSTQHEWKLEKLEIVWKHDARRAECFHTISNFSNFHEC